MNTITRNAFATVKTEGAILPADLLSRVVTRENLPGLAPTQYDLAANERLNEAISRSWQRCLGVWEGFNEQRERLAEAESGVTQTREWLLVLFQELGYGRLRFGRNISVGEGENQRDYPISHLWERTPIHLVSFRQELDRREAAAGRSPHSLVQEFLNRSDDHLWGIVSNGLRPAATGVARQRQPDARRLRGVRPGSHDGRRALQRLQPAVAGVPSKPRRAVGEWGVGRGVWGGRGNCLFARRLLAGALVAQRG
ncbi:MAG: hypothetical protein KDE34_19225 [Anaerolineales bacterium]|nr:hypothetical protein [Anaerolineales bacterium]